MAQIFSKGSSNKAVALNKKAPFKDVGTVVSDVVYTDASSLEPAFQRIRQPSACSGFGIDGGFGKRKYLNGASHRFEWEFGASAIVVTDVVTGKYIEKRSGETLSAGIFRHALEGSFKYDRFGVLVGGVAYGFVRWLGGAGEPDGDSLQYVRFKKPVKISAKSFQDLHLQIASACDKQGVDVLNCGDDPTPPGSESCGSKFKAYSISKLFESSWWDQPFATDIIPG